MTIKRAALTIGRFTPRLRGSRILTYHSVGFRLHEMNVQPDRFREQMTWLAKHHPCITLGQAASGAHGVAITFDDGYTDNLHVAAPILRELNIPFTVFMVAGRAGGLLAHDTDLETSRIMTWDEVRAVEAGGGEVGGHTMTHARLSRLNEDEQRREIGECARVLARELGERPRPFAYPYGSAADFNETSQRLVREMGFTLAVSNRYGANTSNADLWALRRIWIDETDTLAMFQAKVDGRLDLLSALETPAALWGRRTLNRLSA